LTPGGAAATATARPPLVDTHVHLNHDDLLSDLPGVLGRAAAAGVCAMFVVGFDIPSSERAVSLAERDPRLFASVGVHPHDSPAWNRETEARLRAWADHPAWSPSARSVWITTAARTASGRPHRRRYSAGRFPRKSRSPATPDCRS
jgi:Tat protein secretion system quality control protein TatD with DNase activity